MELTDLSTCRRLFWPLLGGFEAERRVLRSRFGCAAAYGDDAAFGDKSGCKQPDSATYVQELVLLYLTTGAWLCGQADAYHFDGTSVVQGLQRLMLQWSWCRGTPAEFARRRCMQ